MNYISKEEFTFFEEKAKEDSSIQTFQIDEEAFLYLNFNETPQPSLRELEKMVKEGLVEKYVLEGTNSACFEYIGESETSDYESCYHCKCEKCGKLIHIQCDEIECLSRHMTEHHDFQLDTKRTVFYGICNECRKNT